MVDLPHVRTNLGDVRAHTRRVAEEITHRWTLHYVWGIGPSGHHAAGRALDLMTLTASQGALRTRVGNEMAAYLQDNADRLGVLYVIWRQRIWNDSRSDDRSRTSWREWRRMEDRGSPTENHMDHVHVSFYNNPPPYRPPEDDMPSAKEIVDELLNRDVVRAPFRDKDDPNRNWQVESALESIWANAYATLTIVREQAKRTGVEVDEAALADAMLPGLLAALDPEAIAAAVADALPQYRLVPVEET